MNADKVKKLTLKNNHAEAMQQSFEIVVFHVLHVFNSSVYNEVCQKINVTSINNQKTLQKNLVKLFEPKYLRIDKAKFVKYILYIWSVITNERSRSLVL